MEVVFCDNRVVSIGGDGTFDDLALSTADLAVERFSSSHRSRIRTAIDR